MSRLKSRRATLGALSGVIIAGALAGARRSRGAELPKLDVKDRAATALGYAEDAKQVDTKRFPSYSKGQQCENCLQLQGSAGNSLPVLFPSQNQPGQKQRVRQIWKRIPKSLPGMNRPQLPSKATISWFSGTELP